MPIRIRRGVSSDTLVALPGAGAGGEVELE